MSLLMQALKKAEHAKQKQSGAAAEMALAEKEVVKAPEDGLSLSPKEIVIEPLAVPEIAVSPASLPAGDSAPLTSPYAQPSPPAFPEIALTSMSAAAVETPPAEQFPSPQATGPDALDSVRAKSAAAETVSRPAPDPLGRIEPAETILPRPVSPKISPAQIEAAAQAEKNISTAQKKAKSVFSAKSPPRNRRTILLALVGLTIGVVFGGLGYIYWQSQSLEAGSLGVPRAVLAPMPPVAVVPDALPKAPETPATPVVVAAAPIPPAAPQTPLPAPAATALPAPPPSPAQLSPAQIAVPAMPEPTPRASSPPMSTPASEAPVPRKAPATTLKTQIAAASVAEAPDSSAIQIRQSSSSNQINPALAGAYQAFISGDPASARQQYQKVLQQDPTNRDALLGMAAIALNQRDAPQAGSFYGKLLELDPTDADAIAGLTSLQQGDPVQSESRLKKILSQNPNSSAILFTLGNLYAQQTRWPDAQQAYFRAYVSAPANADYAFNLAVSLDRLSQVKLAREYYARALDLGQTGPGNFSRAGVQKRIKELDTPPDE